MKILKILGVVIIVLIILYIVGFFRSYTVGSGFVFYEPGTQIEKKISNCYGKNITIYDARPVDGDAKFFCLGFVKTTIKTVNY